MATKSILSTVQENLKGGLYECTSLEKLSGGTANFVYRGILKTPLADGSKTIVIKHTEGYVASNQRFLLTATRADFEQTILSALHEMPPTVYKNVTVRTPHMYDFLPESKVQIHSNLDSSVDLKTYALAHTLTWPQCVRVGRALGSWTAEFHRWANCEAQTNLRVKMKNNLEMATLKYTINYGQLLRTIDMFPKILEGSRKILEAVANNVKEELERDTGVLIHGDFWTGNVLLPNEPFSSDEASPFSLYVIDWELSHVSKGPEFDLGQMFAEFYELTFFKSIDAGVWIIEAFMEEYGGLDEEAAWKTMISIGTHLVVWGSRVPGWGTEEQVRGIVEVGRMLIVAGWERDRSVIEGSDESRWLKCLFKS